MANTHSLDLELSSSQYASIADASQTGLDLSTDFTIECWVKIEQLPSTAAVEMDLVVKDDGANARQWKMVLMDTDDGRVYFFSADATYTIFATTDLVVVGDVGKWVHIAASVDISVPSIQFYKNGAAVTTTSVASNSTTIQNDTAAVAIGARSDGALNYDGLIDDIRVWSDIRTATEINDNKAVQLVGNEANLVAYWKLNNDYLDETANNNDLTASGSPVFSADVPFVGAVSGGAFLLQIL